MADPPPTPPTPPEEAGQNIEADALDSLEEDSAFGDESGSYTTSLSSSIYKYTYENGRRYNAFRQGAYPLPNDEKEQDRLDLVHHVHRLILRGKLHMAPLGPDPGRVLDIGTGTGIWAIDFADEYPSATVIGTDLSPIQPSWVPPNLKFEIDDCEDPWPYSEPFDYIHARTLGGSIKDWPRFLGQAMKHLKPGGWVELQEYETDVRTDDDSIPKPSMMLAWAENVNRAAEKFGKSTNIAKHLKGWLGEAGFVNVQDTPYKVPMGPWAKDKRLKELGRYNQLATLESLQSYTLYLFTNFLGWTVPEAEACLVGVRKELQTKGVHMYGVYRFIIGQKPLETAA